MGSRAGFAFFLTLATACALEHPAIQSRGDVATPDDRAVALDLGVDAPPADVPIDRGADETPTDVAPDVAEDAGPDIADVTLDVSQDTVFDSGTDVGDGGIDATPDAFDTGMDAPDAGCHANAECDDHDTCTTDTCDLASGRCTTVRVPMCCTAATQCDDGNACTTDACGEGNRCVNSAITGCCMTSAQCDDSNRCTRDECTDGRCVRTTVAGCCSNATQCDDGNACTTDNCNLTSNVCERTAVAMCCTSAMQCDDRNACTTDACTGSACVNLPIEGCCTSDVQCDDANACTADRCNASACEHPRVAVAGDHCENAIALTPANTVQTREGDSTACATSDTMGNNDLVYSVTLGAGSYVFYADTYGSDFNTRITLRDGCVGAALATSDDQCGRTQSQFVAVISGGRTVSLVVGGAGMTDRGRVVLHYLVAAVPAGLTYQRAEPATSATTPRTVSGSTGAFVAFRGCVTGSGASDTLRPSCADDGTGPEQVWVSATCPGARMFTAATCSDASWYTVVSVIVPAATPRVLACNDDGCSRQSRASGSTPEAAGPVFVVVDGFYDYWSCGDYRLSLTNFYY